MKEIGLFTELNFKESIHFNIIKSPFKEILVYRPDQDKTNDILSYLKHIFIRIVSTRSGWEEMGTFRNKNSMSTPMSSALLFAIAKR